MWDANKDTWHHGLRRTRRFQFKICLLLFQDITGVLLVDVPKKKKKTLSTSKNCSYLWKQVSQNILFLRITTFVMNSRKGSFCESFQECHVSFKFSFKRSELLVIFRSKQDEYCHFECSLYFFTPTYNLYYLNKTLTIGWSKMIVFCVELHLDWFCSSTCLLMVSDANGTLSIIFIHLGRSSKVSCLVISYTTMMPLAPR